MKWQLQHSVFGFLFHGSNRLIIKARHVKLGMETAHKRT
jgi:hypothetical protein